MRAFWQILHHESAESTLQFYSFVNILPAAYFRQFLEILAVKYIWFGKRAGFSLPCAFVNIRESFNS